ncbi:MAG TPA: GspH/FimT family pseudopilin [Candidatus Eisenbacteria bacterium]
MNPFRRSNPSAPRSGERGFSLVELMVSIALMSIMFLVGLPAMNRYLKTNRLLAASANLAGELRLARQRAVSEENNVVFSWNLTDDKYRWLDDDDNDGSADTGEYVSEWRQLPDGIDLDAGATPLAGTSVTFLSSGSASQGGQLTVTNEEGLERTIQLVQVSGLVKVLS